MKFSWGLFLLLLLNVQAFANCTDLLSTIIENQSHHEIISNSLENITGPKKIKQAKKLIGKDVDLFIDTNEELINAIKDRYQISLDTFYGVYLRSGQNNLQAIGKALLRMDKDLETELIRKWGINKAQYFKYVLNFTSLDLAEIVKNFSTLTQASGNLDIPLGLFLQKLSNAKLTVNEFVEAFNKELKIARKQLAKEQSPKKMGEMIKAPFDWGKQKLSKETLDFRLYMENIPDNEKFDRAFKYVSKLPFDKAKKIYQEMLLGLKLRKANNPDFFKTLGVMLAIDNVSMVIGHMMAWGFDKLAIYTSQTISFSILEIVLNFASVKSAAKLAANPEWLINARRASKVASAETKGKVAKIAQHFASYVHKMGPIGKIITDMTQESPKNFGKTFGITLLPYSASAALMPGSAADKVARALIDSIYTGVFAAVSTRFRYGIQYDVVFKYLNKVLDERPLLKRNARGTVILINMFTGSVTYSYMYKILVTSKEDEKEAKEDEDETVLTDAINNQ